MIDPSYYSFEHDGYKAFQSYDDPDIFIEKSPYYTFCDFCSPCAPGAGYLTTEGNVKTYCFGHDWFFNSKAPYRVFSVETKEEIFPN
jgi:hypothetical protein